MLYTYTQTDNQNEIIYNMVIRAEIKKAKNKEETYSKTPIYTGRFRFSISRNIEESEKKLITIKEHCREREKKVSVREGKFYLNIT